MSWIRLSVWLALALAGTAAWGQAPPKPTPAKPAPTPAKPAPAKPNSAKPAPQKPAVQPAPRPGGPAAKPGPAAQAAKPPAEDPVRGEEYLFKMAVAIVKEGTQVGALVTQGSVSTYGATAENGKTTAEVEYSLRFPDQMRLRATGGGYGVQIEVRDSVATYTVSGMGQKIPADELLAELARHPVNLALRCRRIKALYLGLETVEGAKLIRLKVTDPGHTAGPIELLLDPKTFLPRRERYTGKDPTTGAPGPIEEVFADWRGSGGVKVPYSRQIRSQGLITSEYSLTSHAVYR